MPVQEVEQQRRPRLAMADDEDGAVVERRELARLGLAGLGSEPVGDAVDRCEQVAPGGLDPPRMVARPRLEQRVRTILA